MNLDWKCFIDDYVIFLQLTENLIVKTERFSEGFYRMMIYFKNEVTRKKVNFFTTIFPMKLFLKSYFLKKSLLYNVHVNFFPWLGTSIEIYLTWLYITYFRKRLFILDLSDLLNRLSKTAEFCIFLDKSNLVLQFTVKR